MTCELIESPKDFRDGMWCLTHKLPADHCGTDGDTPICKTQADTHGCNCCPENFKKSVNELGTKLRVLLPPLGEGYHYELITLDIGGYAVVVEKTDSCKYTFSHTRKFCGNSNCRES